MKAAIHTEYGPADVVRVGHLPDPTPGPGDVLVRVRFSTVNRTDTGFRSAEYVISRLFSGLFRPKNPVLGCEFAGDVIAVGSAVTQFAVGDRVFGFDDEGFGAHAELKRISQDAGLSTIPEGWTYEQAAALTEGSHYALCNLRSAKVQAEQRILINGSTGAIGSAAVQLCAAMGAEVTAVCATPHLELVRSLGAHRVVDYTTTDVVSLGGSYHVVYDAVGKRRFRDFLPVMEPDGVYMSTELGPGGENVWLGILGLMKKGRRVLFPIPTISREDIETIKSLAIAGKFRPVIDRIYPLDDITEAHRYVGSGMKTGNVLIRIE